MDGGRGVGLDRVKHGRAARHAAGVPVLQLAPGDQDQRVIGVGPLVGRDDVGRHKTRTTAFAWEVIDEDHRVTWVTLGHAGVGNGMFTLQPFPGDATNAGHGVAHLVKHFADMLVVPGQAQLIGDALDNPQVLSRFAWRVDRLPTHLHQTIGVGEGAGFFGEGACGQDHVGQVRGFGQENVLHHQMLQRGQSPTCMVGVGVRHGWVFALHVHALDAAVMDGVHHLHHGQADLLVE